MNAKFEAWVRAHVPWPKYVPPDELLQAFVREVNARAERASAGTNLFVIHKPIHDPFGYYREHGHGYTTLAEAWRVPEDVARKHIGGRPTDHDRVVMEPAPPTKPDHYAAMRELLKEWGIEE